MPIWLLNREGALIAFISISILTNNSSLKKNLGTVNGVSGSFAFLARIISPIMSGFLLTWSIKSKASYPLDFHLVFYTLTIPIIITVVITFMLPASINSQLESKKDRLLVEENSKEDNFLL